ncbi:hypothetical protein Ddc_15948 [Ditylenchus destructor]|nr:hypothetical protein Ddc_15948 [Ditylenchus destructor]
MSSLPNEIFSDLTNFLPNDDITDLMLLSRKFNALVTPRLRRINEDRATMNQTIESFMPTPAPEDHDEWISQLNLKRFKPIGSVAKKRMKKLLANVREFEDCFHKFYDKREIDIGTFDILKEGMSLERFDDTTFLRILFTLVSTPQFRQEYNVPTDLSDPLRACLIFIVVVPNQIPSSHFEDVVRIFNFYDH